MYFIVNKTNRSVVIQDLNVVLQSKIGIDLEKICSKNKILSSSDLKTLIHQGVLEVRGSVKPKEPHPAERQTDNPDLKSIKDDMKELKKAISGIGNNPDLTSVLQQLTSLLQSQKLSVIYGSKSEIGSENKSNRSPDNDINEDILNSIHAKAVKNMTKDLEANISYTEENIKDSPSERAKELDGLL